jgi:hypothetical protein
MRPNRLFRRLSSRFQAFWLVQRSQILVGDWRGLRIAFALGGQAPRLLVTMWRRKFEKGDFLALTGAALSVDGKENHLGDRPVIRGPDHHPHRLIALVLVATKSQTRLGVAPERWIQALRRGWMRESRICPCEISPAREAYRLGKEPDSVGEHDELGRLRDSRITSLALLLRIGTRPAHTILLEPVDKRAERHPE